MKRIVLLFTGLALMFQVAQVRADEGMWLPMLIEKLNIGEMTEMGLKLSAEDIYSINQACLKDAIVALDRGSCTAEVISEEGLLLTNHHCGYGEIQAHSNVEHDYLTDGFWALSKKEELPNPGKTASFLVRAEDVTEKILAEVSADMEEAKRHALIDSVSQVIASEAKGDDHYRTIVQSMLKGNQFILFVYEDFLDVRLVGAPPESIGKFGADTDNWMWPRHTGDFSMFRVYAGPDGKPAPYSEENVPHKPKSHLTISLDGVKEGDFAMIMGYPGTTQRYLSSWGVENTMKYSNEFRAEIRGIKQDIWKEAMDRSDEVRIKYSSKFARSSNYWKYSIGQNKGLKALDVVGKKKELEKEFSQWVNANKDRKEKYGDALKLIEDYQTSTAETQRDITILLETLLIGTEAPYFSYRVAAGLEKVLETNPDSTEYIEKFQKRSKVATVDFFKDYEASLDQKVMKAMIRTFMEMAEKENYPEFVNEIGDVDKIDKYVDQLFKKSIFVDQEKLEEFIADPDLKTLKKDPAFIAGKQILNKYRSVAGSMMAKEADFAKGQRLFVAGLMEMNPDKSYYPNANSSMRLTYGTVGGYDPKDAVHYKYYTTLEGVMAKEDPDVREFNVKPRLKELYEAKGYGRYADENGKMVVAFLTNNDITGGNSGSPVMNDKGQLIGIAFDGNWEAMSGDIAFEPDLQRTICVDIRYVLFVVDKFAGAKNLVNEMTIVKE
ncbi:MAG: S46 family peptidase [Salinivirgaceae bacterium]|jgi:hypothetical protein|nr:S46 family peptidase [Salinivirgaceae bacterium]